MTDPADIKVVATTCAGCGAAASFADFAGFGWCGACVGDRIDRLRAAGATEAADDLEAQLPKVYEQQPTNEGGTSMTEQHTPGPWAVRWRTDGMTDELRAMLKDSGREVPKPVETLTNDGQRVVMAGEDKRVAVVDLQSPAKRGQAHAAECSERDANARLIAAAPDLLEAARVAVAELGHFTTAGVMDALRAAVAKATEGDR